jgi:hypothetical protein
LTLRQPHRAALRIGLAGEGPDMKKGRSEPPRFPSLFGGAREDRTPDLLNAIQALSHLSYDPTGEKHHAVAAAMPGV